MYLPRVIAAPHKKLKSINKRVWFSGEESCGKEHHHQQLHKAHKAYRLRDGNGNANGIGVRIQWQDEAETNNKRIFMALGN